MDLDDQELFFTQVKKKLYKDKELKEIKELNLENQAFYEEMNCDDNEYISKKYLQLKEKNKKLQKEIEELKKPKYIMNFETGSVTKIDNDFISKDKALKALGYEENSEAYNRMDSEEKVISLIRLVNAECNRLEDIEDKKVMLEEHNIENMRDKYWQDKIRKRLEKLKEKEQELSDEQGYFGSSELQAKIEELEELLGE